MNTIATPFSSNEWKIEAVRQPNSERLKKPHEFCHVKKLWKKFLCNDSFVVNLTSGPIVEAEEPGEFDFSKVLDNRLLSIRCDVGKGKICFNACVDGEWGK
ncbi:hypothetical protein ANCDUO_10210 [Ancylostoma duodenale]|uniref:Galectin n=1 Tax=Ancylostoma duodenale TaxID=51022 RepID=A0A0C2GRD7_9BILA|nr:hypothetical protein ANCDUO_10210 [Ancylostoma duodenale]